MAKVFYTQQEIALKRDLLQHFRNELPSDLQEGLHINDQALVGYFPSEHAVTSGIGGYSLYGPFVEGEGCPDILLGVDRSELVAWCKGNMEVLK